MQPLRGSIPANSQVQRRPAEERCWLLTAGPDNQRPAVAEETRSTPDSESVQGTERSLIFLSGLYLSFYPFPARTEGNWLRTNPEQQTPCLSPESTEQWLCLVSGRESLQGHQGERTFRKHSSCQSWVQSEAVSGQPREKIKQFSKGTAVSGPGPWALGPGSQVSNSEQQSMLTLMQNPWC